MAWRRSLPTRSSSTHTASLAVAVALLASSCSGDGSEAQAVSAGTEAPALASSLLETEEPFLHRPMDRLAPGFTLIDYTGETVSLSDFQGKWVLIDWVYTNCLTVCPLLTNELNIVRRGLGGGVGDDVQFVSISFDPEVDTPAALEAHAVSVGGAVPGWAWLTGDQDQTDAVAAAYGVSYDPAAAISGVPQFDHTALMVIVDPQGRERHRYLGTGWSQDVLQRLATDRSAPADGAVVAAESVKQAPATEQAVVGAEDLLADAIALGWEDWELESGVTAQTLYQFPSSGARVAFVDFMRSEAAGNGLEVSSGQLSAMRYDLVEWPDGLVTAVGYTDANIAVVLKGTVAGDLRSALYVIDDDWCCTSP